MIRRFLDCSTAHLSAATCEWLDQQLAEATLRDPANTTAIGIAGGKTRHGWFVYAPEDPPETIPEDLTRICNLARQLDAEYVLIDCDAPLCRGLPIRHPDVTGKT